MIDKEGVERCGECHSDVVVCGALKQSPKELYGWQTKPEEVCEECFKDLFKICACGMPIWAYQIECGSCAFDHMGPNDIDGAE